MPFNTLYHIPTVIDEIHLQEDTVQVLSWVPTGFWLGLYIFYTKKDRHLVKERTALLSFYSNSNLNKKIIIYWPIGAHIYTAWPTGSPAPDLLSLAWQVRPPFPQSPLGSSAPSAVGEDDILQSDRFNEFHSNGLLAGSVYKLIYRSLWVFIPSKIFWTVWNGDYWSKTVFQTIIFFRFVSSFILVGCIILFILSFFLRCLCFCEFLGILQQMLPQQRRPWQRWQTQI